MMIRFPRRGLTSRFSTIVSWFTPRAEALRLIASGADTLYLSGLAVAFGLHPNTYDIYLQPLSHERVAYNEVWS